MAATSDSSPATSSTSSDEKRWEVVDIIAERTTVDGVNEFLVVWKPSWVPASDFSCPEHFWRRWDETPKWTSCSNATIHAMQVCLAVEPGSQMETDLANARAMVARMDDTHTAAAHRQQADDIRAKASRVEGARSVGRAPYTSELLSDIDSSRSSQNTTTEQ